MLHPNHLFLRQTTREKRAQEVVREVVEKLAAPTSNGKGGPALPKRPEAPSIDPVKPPKPPSSVKAPKPVKFNPQTNSGTTQGVLKL